MKTMTDEERAAALQELIVRVRAENTPERRAVRKAAELELAHRRRTRYARECAMADTAVLSHKHGENFRSIYDAKSALYGYTPSEYDANDPYTNGHGSKEAQL